MSIGETSGRSLKGDSRPSASRPAQQWFPGPAGEGGGQGRWPGYPGNTPTPMSLTAATPLQHHQSTQDFVCNADIKWDVSLSRVTHLCFQK